MKRASLIVGVMALAAILVQMAADRFHWQVDLTERGLFTLNQASEEIVANLEEPLEIRLYLSGNLPARLRPVADFIQSMIDAYQRAGQGKVSVTVVDPGNSGEAVEAANQLGIFRTKANVTTGNKVEVVDIWFGLALFYGDRHEVFPTMGVIENVEYDISSAIARLSSAGDPSIYLVGPTYLQERLGFVFDVRYDLKTLARELGKNAKVVQERIEPNGPIPNLKNADLVIAWGLHRFREDQLYAIDQHLMAGKPLLLLAAGTYINAANLSAAPVPDNRADRFYAHLGFRVGRALVADSQSSKIRYTDVQPPALKAYPLYPRLTPGVPGLNPEHTATAYLQSLVVPWVSPIEVQGSNDVQATLLATSSDQAWLLEDPLIIDPAQVPGPTQFDAYVLGAALTGRFRSFFAEAPADVTGATHRAESPADTHLLVWGSEHMLTQTQDSSLVAWAQHTTGFLTHRALMSGIDRRDNTFRPIRQTDDATKTRYQYLSVTIVPLLVLIWALCRGWLRRRSHRQFVQIMKDTP